MNGAGFLSEYTPEDGFYSGLFYNRNGSFLANAAGVFILSVMQKACHKNMLGRLMAVFRVCSNIALPIGIWMHGVISYKCGYGFYPDVPRHKSRLRQQLRCLRQSEYKNRLLCMFRRQ